MEYQTCKEEINKLAQEYSSSTFDRNEATTRLHIIDRLLFQCLGWDKDDCTSEDRFEGRYTDYTLSNTSRVLIVEAKKEGIHFKLPAGEKDGKYKIQSLCDDFPSLNDAIEQVKDYCQSRGVPIGVVCNGHQLVAFMASRNDGVPPMNGDAFLLSSLESFVDHFKDLWDYLSKSGVGKKNLENFLTGFKSASLPPKLSKKIASYPGNKDRNPYQTDLKIVSDLVLQDVPRSDELESRFLSECYCKSGALSQYALISKKILEKRYAALYDNHVSGPTTIPATDKSGISKDIIADSLSRRPILLIGDVGVGKTTFIRNLVNVEAFGIFEDAITLYINLGTQASLTENIREFILRDISEQLFEKYEIDIHERNFVRGVYDKDIKRFENSIYGDYKESAPEKFKAKEIEYIETLKKPIDKHLRSSIGHISKGRKKQVIVFIDNADQRDSDTQQSAFLIGQELADNWPATVFITIRPETFYKSQKSGALSGYHPKSFTISPPRIDRVVNKRLDFALKIASGDIPISSLERDTIVKFERLKILIKVFQYSLNNNDELIEAISNISGGNVRIALDFITNFFGSAHVDTEKIIDIHKDQEWGYIIPIHEFLRAIIYGDNIYYDPNRSPIANLFDISTNDPKEHFLMLGLLRAVNSLADTALETGFVSTKQIYEFIQGFKFTPKQIDFALARAHDKNLITVSTRSKINIPNNIPETIRITTDGAYHIQRLVKMFTYIDAVIVDIPILDTDYRQQINVASVIPDRLKNCKLLLKYLDQYWSESNLTDEFFNWEEISSQLENDFKKVKRGYNRYKN